MPDQSKPVDTLLPLTMPDSTYTSVILDMLIWIMVENRPTYRNLIEWFSAKYKTDLTTSRINVQNVIRLGLVSPVDEGKLRFTEHGFRIFKPGDDDRDRILAQRVLLRCIGMPELLAICAVDEVPKSAKDIVRIFRKQFPKWIQPDQIYYRLAWLVSLGCVRHGELYEITDFGRKALGDYERITHETDSPTERSSHMGRVNHRGFQPRDDDPVEFLVKELEEASSDGHAPGRFEWAVVDAFKFLGFKAQHLGGPGRGDGLIRADTGPYSYKVVADSKARNARKLQTMEAYTLQEHRIREGADYIAVVAGSFSGTKLIRQAVENNIALLSVPVLAEWLWFHRNTPLNLEEYRAMFSTPGVVTELPASMQEAANNRTQWGQILSDIMETIQEAYDHGVNYPLTASAIHSTVLMRQKGKKYAIEDIDHVIHLLLNPAIQAMLQIDGGTALAVNTESLASIFRSLADYIDPTARQKT